MLYYRHNSYCYAYTQANRWTILVRYTGGNEADQLSRDLRGVEWIDDLDSALRVVSLYASEKCGDVESATS